MRAIPNGEVIRNAVTGARYSVGDRLGEGGFGVAYRAHELNAQGGKKRDGETCLKFTLDPDAWHGEVYFLNLLKGDGHVVRMNSAFPAEVSQGASTKMAFVIDMELIDDGTVEDHLETTGSGWTEQQVIFRTRQLLKPLALMHAMGVSHRDITPSNVFVGNRKVLKLGDFGITKAQLRPSGVHVDYLAEAFAPNDLGQFWSPREDVYQLGLLMASLAAGRIAYTGLRRVEVNAFTTKGQLRQAIKAAISVRSQRPRDATELAELLNSPA